MGAGAIAGGDIMGAGATVVVGGEDTAWASAPLAQNIGRQIAAARQTVAATISPMLRAKPL